MGKEEWKNTGKELGGAFTGLAKSLIRSAKTGIDKVEDWAEEDTNKQPEPQVEESNVFNDGTWRETGKNLGKAFMGLGKTIVGTGEEALEKAEEWAEKDDDNKPEE
ncbi:MAG: hypothetical protein J6S31_04855 [Lachnospiraceae bacterium]|nr:hypothetical protein [Lachnospiraceae bacterium]